MVYLILGSSGYWTSVTDEPLDRICVWILTKQILFVSDQISDYKSLFPLKLKDWDKKWQFLGILTFFVMDIQVQCRFWQEWGRGYEACVNLLRFISIRNIVWFTCHFWVEGDISALWLGFELLVWYMMVLYI